MSEAEINRVAEEIYKKVFSREILVSCTEAARLMGVTRKTVSVMVAQGRLKKITIGESTGIRLSDINPL